ncbi:MAG TPA: hypothetical protein VLH94_02180 [Spirochaetia bacterium]|nr:hypothetical protein [Spirochaetia bacterium]
MSKPRLPSFGDVIVSERFKYGHLNYDGKPPIQVGQNSPKCLVSRFLTDEEIDEIKKAGKKPPKMIEEDLGVPDPSRATAEFVVINNNMQGGGTGMGVIYGHNDDYPDGWHIVAKRLKDGKWDPEGEEIAFYMTGSFIDMIFLNEVKIVRHMAMSYI